MQNKHCLNLYAETIKSIYMYIHFKYQRSFRRVQHDVDLSSTYKINLKF